MGTDLWEEIFRLRSELYDPVKVMHDIPLEAGLRATHAPHEIVLSEPACRLCAPGIRSCERLLFYPVAIRELVALISLSCWRNTERKERKA